MWIEGGASNNTVGGAAAGAGNIISGNSGDGVYIQYLNGDPTGASNNIIQGNWIGVDSTGKQALGNMDNGIELWGATGTIIASNVISGNGTGAGGNGLSSDGICIQSKTSGTQIWGNLIGLGQDEVTPVGNANDGVYIQAGCKNNSVGVAGGAENYISANGGWGVEDDTAAGDDPAIVNNVIGYDNSNPRKLVRNMGGGFYSASGTAPGAGNLIQP